MKIFKPFLANLMLGLLLLPTTSFSQCDDVINSISFSCGSFSNGQRLYSLTVCVTTDPNSLDGRFDLEIVGDDINILRFNQTSNPGQERCITIPNISVAANAAQDIEVRVYPHHQELILQEVFAGGDCTTDSPSEEYLTFTEMMTGIVPIFWMLLPWLML